VAKKKMGGIAGIWLEEHVVVNAAQKTRESGFTKFDAITPYPVHGMEEACGIKRSWIPYVTFVSGAVGLAAALWLTWWTSAVDWPINVGGKPFFSWPAFVPIMFEVTVLFAALCSVAALFVVTKMPSIDPPSIDPDLTSHKFAIFVPQNDVGYDEAKIERMFREWGAADIKKVAEY
jgi:hypothetical protein